MAFLLSGCSAFERLGMRIFFDPTAWPEDRVLRDISYLDEAEGEADAAKQRLNFFLPEATERRWPTLIFVHGGSWREGDRDLVVGGQDVYGNIGRFYAARGIGVAVISYRLQPAVKWRQQVEDVASAVRWVGRNVEAHGGDPAAIFLSGHSAGAQLASFATLADWPLDATDRGRICGVVAISGAGYDLADEKTYELGADREFYEKTFRDGEAEVGWQEEASVLAFLRDPASAPPPFLVFHAEKEHQALHRQASLMHRAVEKAGSPSRRVEIPKVGHRRIVVEFSQQDSLFPAAVTDFIETHRRCGSAVQPSAP